MSAQLEIEHRSELADAKLGVAEELAWPLAGFAALAAHLKWENWVLTVPIAVAIYFIATLKYHREASRAEDEYFRVAGLGKYANRGKADDA